MIEQLQLIGKRPTGRRYSDSTLAMCLKGHVWTKNVKYICRTIFNMGGKNYTSELNGQIHANRKRKAKETEISAIDRKICKLQSSKL